jgi:hypothetical protein
LVLKQAHVKKNLTTKSRKVEEEGVWGCSEFGRFPVSPCMRFRFVEMVCKCRSKEAVRTGFFHLFGQPLFFGACCSKTEVSEQFYYFCVYLV